MKVIEVSKNKFSIDLIDELLIGQTSGKYKIVITTSHAIWECFVKYNGRDWVDLYQLPH